MDLIKILKSAVDKNASDVFIIAGRPVSFCVNGEIEKEDENTLMPDNTRDLISQIYALTKDREDTALTVTGNDDFSFAVPGLSRFRVSAYKQRNSLAAVIRVISFDLPDPTKIGIPDSIMKLAERKKGMVLVTGTAGNGKSTTLACIIDHINSTENKHIITLEDPLEYMHHHKKSIVSQREIGTDVPDYLTALRSALRQKPHVILLGEMRDYETIDVAMTAAETGHMVFSTLHTIGAANTIERIIDVFPANQQQQIRVQLAGVLSCVVSQQLVPAVDGTQIPAFEIMNVNPAVRNMIRDDKIHQLDNVIATSKNEDMISMDTYLYNLYKAGKITRDTMLMYATNPALLAMKM